MEQSKIIDMLETYHGTRVEVPLGEVLPYKYHPTIAKEIWAKETCTPFKLQAVLVAVLVRGSTSQAVLPSYYRATIA